MQQQNRATEFKALLGLYIVAKCKNGFLAKDTIFGLAKTGFAIASPGEKYLKIMRRNLQDLVFFFLKEAKKGRNYALFLVKEPQLYFSLR